MFLSRRKSTPKKKFGLISTLNRRGLGTEARLLKEIFLESIDDVEFSIYVVKASRTFRAFDENFSKDKEFTKWLGDKDYVMTIETFMPKLYAECRRRGIFSIWRPNFEWILPRFSKDQFSSVDLIMAPQTSCSEFLVNTFGLSNVINNPWIMSLQVKKKNPRKDKTHFLFNAGRGGVGDRRNTKIVIEAFERVLRSRQDIHLTIKTQKVLDVSRLQVFGKSQFKYVCRNASYAKNLEYYSMVDFSVAPSKWEGVGFALLESLYSGTPVLTVDAPPMNEWVSHKKTGFLVPVEYPEVELPIPFDKRNQEDGLNWVKAANCDVMDIVDGIHWLADNRESIYSKFNLANEKELNDRKRQFLNIFRTAISNRAKEVGYRGNIVHLAIVEVDYHAEVLQKLVPLLVDGDFQLSLFVNSKVKNKLNFSDTVWCKINCKVCSNREHVKEFLKRHSVDLECADIVYFNTIERSFSLFQRLSLKVPYILCTHNLNTDFFPRQNIDLVNKSKFKILSYLFWRVLVYGQWRKKKALINGASGIFCGNQSLTEYLKANNRQLSSKVVDFPLPFIWSDNNKSASMSDRSDKGTVIAVVPGSVNVNRKNYSVIYEAVVQALPILNKRLQLVFLGRPVGSEGMKTIDRFNSIDDEKLVFESFDESVEASEFERILTTCDFILGSVKINTSRKIYSEVYGQTKISGIDSDIITSQTPALINADYQLDPELEKVCVQYEDAEDLAAKLVDWVENEGYMQYKKKFASLDSYEYGAIQKRFYEFCRRVSMQS